MAESNGVPYGRKTQHDPAVKEVHVLWIPAGLGCDGDSVSITAATQPSIEDIVLGTIPGLPKVHLHNPVLGIRERRRVLKFWNEAADGQLDPSSSSSRARSRTRTSRPRDTGRRWAPTRDRPADPDLDWIDRLAPKAGRSWRGTCAAYGGIHAMAGNPTGCMGLADYLGWDWNRRRAADHQRPRLPGAARQLHGDAALPALPGGGWRRPSRSMSSFRPTWLSARRSTRVATAPAITSKGTSPTSTARQVPRKDRLLGPGRELQRAQARLDGRHRRLPQRRRHLHRLHHAGVPRQVHAVYGRAARRKLSTRMIGVYGSDGPLPARLHQRHDRTLSRSGDATSDALTTG